MLGIQPDDIEQLLDALVLLAAGADSMNLKRLGDDLADGHARVQARVRVLEDELHVAPVRLQIASLETERVLAVER